MYIPAIPQHIMKLTVAQRVARSDSDLSDRFEWFGTNVYGQFLFIIGLWKSPGFESAHIPLLSFVCVCVSVLSFGFIVFSLLLDGVMTCVEEEDWLECLERNSP